MQMQLGRGSSMKTSIRSFVAAVAAVSIGWTGLSVGVAHADGHGGYNSKVVYAGISGHEDTIAGFAGFIWATGGNLDASGLMLRASALYVDYDFASTLAASGTANGTIGRGSVSIGYQFVSGGAALSIYGGVDYQDRNISPAAADTGTLNDDVGFIAAARLSTVGSVSMPASIEGNYSTANDTYWAKAKIGHRFNGMQIGPEVAVLGDEDYNAVRIGGYTGIDLSGSTLQLGVGYNFADQSGTSRGGDGVYGSAVLVFVF